MGSVFVGHPTLWLSKAAISFDRLRGTCCLLQGYFKVTIAAKARVRKFVRRTKVYFFPVGHSGFHSGILCASMCKNQEYSPREEDHKVQ